MAYTIDIGRDAETRAKRLENKRRRIDEVHTSETEGAKKLRLERSCERAALEHLAEPDKAKKLRLEKRRDSYVAEHSAETKKLRKSYDMGLTTHPWRSSF